ncbi:MAG: endo-1,4-beta-xylanase, partial [Candidatus Uhrbacteria bacterium]|nr:endo-1,4-beta-xylanase [Candidatus Uhrbacteria bacterium]
VTGDDAKEQSNQYVLALDACLRAPNCTSYTTWGVSDAYGSTTRSDRYPLVYGTSLLFDKDFKPKPAYAALQARLRLP